jgi:hypothetical protein
VALNPEDPTVRWAAFGRQVEFFLKSDVGDYLLQRYKQMMDEASEQLKTIDPHDWQAIQRAQNKIKVAELFMTSLAEAIAAGESAMEELKNAAN